MSFSGFMRRQLFVIDDWLRGGRQSRHYQYMQRMLKNPNAFKKIQPQLLHSLLQHAVSTTEQYHLYKDFSSLEDFPVIPRELFSANYPDFCSNEFKPESLIKRWTSGSYGTPLGIHFTREKIIQQMTEILYFNRQSGFRLGEPFIQFRVQEKSKWKLFMQNSTMVKSERISEEWLQASRKILLNTRNHFLVTYPSALLQLAVYCREMGDTPDMFGFKNMVTSGEILTQNARTIFEKVFECKVHDRYATLETGVLAHQCPRCGLYHVNFPDYHIELVKRDRDEPVEAGEPGRIIITDYHARAVPLVRYDIGDISEWADPADSCDPLIPSLKKIVGRKDDYVSSGTGELINPEMVFKAFSCKDNTQILQYQLVQTERDQFLVNLVVTPKYQGEKEISTRLLNILGNSSQLRFEYMEDIPPLPSGKRPAIINYYTPSLRLHNQE